MESDRRINFGIVIIASILILAGISFIPDVQAREGYIMNLLLSMMHDVQITNPINGQVLTYQNGFWINANGGGGESTECINMASQYQIIVNSTDGNCYVRALANGDNIIISQNATHLIINATGTESTVCSNSAISGFTLIQSSSGGNCVFKKLRAGTGISLSSNSTHITVTNSLPEQGCTSAGGTTLLKTASTCDFKGLSAGTGITITSGTNTNTIDSSCNNTGSGEAVCESANNINSLIATSPITISDTTGDLTIACPTCSTSGNNDYSLLCTNSIQGSASTSLSCSSFTATKYLKIYLEVRGVTSTAKMGITFNSDGGTNYSRRTQLNGGAEVTGTSENECRVYGDQSISAGAIAIVLLDIDNNIASDRKVAFTHVADTGTSGATGAPLRSEGACKWDNTSAQISTVTLTRVSGTGSYDTNTRIWVFGFD